MKLRIIELPHPEQLSDCHFHRQLLVDFPDKRVPGFLSRLDFPPGNSHIPSNSPYPLCVAKYLPSRLMIAATTSIFFMFSYLYG